MLYSRGSRSLASRVPSNQRRDDLSFLLWPQGIFLFFSSLPIFNFWFLFLFLFCYYFCLISCYLAYTTQGTPSFRFASPQEDTVEDWNMVASSSSFPPTSLLKDILVPVLRYFCSSVMFLFISHLPLNINLYLQVPIAISNRARSLMMMLSLPSDRTSKDLCSATPSYGTSPIPSRLFFLWFLRVFYFPSLYILLTYNQKHTKI